MKNLIRKHTLFKIILIALLLFFLIYHSLTLLGIIPYENLWGSSLSEKAALTAAEGFAVFFMLLFLSALFLESHSKPLIQKSSSILLWFCAVYMLLNFFGYLRCNSIILTILLGGLTLITTVITVLFQVNKNKIKKAKARKNKSRSESSDTNRTR